MSNRNCRIIRLLAAIIEPDRPVTSLMPFSEDDPDISFRERKLLPEFVALPEVFGEATAYINEDRDRL